MEAAASGGTRAVGTYISYTVGRSLAFAKGRQGVEGREQNHSPIEATDATIAPPKTAIYFNERFTAARHKEIYRCKGTIHVAFCVQRKVYRLVTLGRVSRDTVFQEIPPGAGLKPTISKKKS